MSILNTLILSARPLYLSKSILYFKENLGLIFSWQQILLFLIFSLLSFWSSYYLIYKMIPFLRSIGLVGKDINKKDHPNVAEGGGLPVYLSFSFTFLLAIFSFTVWFYLAFHLIYYIVKIYLLSFLFSSFIMYASMSLIFAIGFMEDLYNLSKHKLSVWGDGAKEKKKGFSNKSKFIFPFIASLPLMILAVYYNFDAIYVPFVNNWVYVGLWYALLFVPVGVIGASNALNLLAGLNGLEASLSFVTYLALAIFSIFKLHSFILTLFTLLFAFTSLGFLLFNKYPSMIFPGDSYTYMSGLGIAIFAILGRAEYFALSVFVIWFIELFLKLKSKMKAESFGKLNAKGGLDRPYDKIYSLTHVFMNGKRGEKEIVGILTGIQAFICFISLLIFVFL